MARSSLSRKQLIEARKQAKLAREKELEALSQEDQKAFEEKMKQLQTKRDNLGFTREERSQIAEKKTEINTPKPKLTWQFEEGELVYLPDGSVGIIVENNARDLELSNFDIDMKKNINQRYIGQVYVVTSSGNNWYYHKTLKPFK